MTDLTFLLIFPALFTAFNLFYWVAVYWTRNKGQGTVAYNQERRLDNILLIFPALFTAFNPFYWVAVYWTRNKG